MQYKTLFSTTRTFNFLRVICLHLLGLVICLGSSASLNLKAEASPLPLSQAARKRKVSKQASKPAPKPNRPLTAKEQRAAEQRLADLGYWTGKIDGRWDAVSRQALIAFQKVEGRRRTGQMTQTEFQALLRAQPPVPHETGEPHIEVDLRRQVLFFVDDTGKVSKILPVSTGNGKEFTSQGWTRSAFTPPGRFNVYHKVAGWRKSPMGRLYYPAYILGGIAIHGYPSVPTKPASHGCIRIPMAMAPEFSKLTPIGTSVIVHDTEPVIAEKEIRNLQQ
jgi:lipoprotein-anchoring transpeptidase ErfK/SrfK